MPSVEDAIKADRSNLTPIESKPEAQKPPARDNRVDSLLKSPYARCPLPPSNNSADSLRQWGQGSEVPKFRTQTPPSNVTGGGGGTTVVHVGTVNAGGSGGGGGTPSTPILPTAQSVSTTTPPLAPGQTWQGTLQIAKAFIMQSVAVNLQARVELYGTKAGQTLDLSRPITTPPPSTTQSIIMDVALQSALIWKVLDCVGSNSDSTQSSTIYITVTNLSGTVGAITVSMQFVPEQS